MDVRQLSDSELREELVRQGLNIGPVTTTTRNIYEKKLLKLLHVSHGDEDRTVPQNGNGVEEEPVEKIVEETFTKKIYPVLQETEVAPPSVRRRAVIEQIDDPVEEGSDDEAEETSRFLTEEEQRHLASPRRKHPVAKKGGAIKQVLVILLLVVLAVFLYHFSDHISQLSANSTEETV